MKLAFVIPLLDDYDINKNYEVIKNTCADLNVQADVVFALNSKLSSVFTSIRNTFGDDKNVKAFLVDRSVDQHKLVTIAMKKTENYDATVIYSGKQDISADVIKAFVTSYQAGNKIVYLKKIKRGIRRLVQVIKNGIYAMGIKLLGVFKDLNAENDIQLLDQDVVKTINQLPSKNRQLRTLDALLHYTTDIIHLEVSAQEPVNKTYNPKNKQYKLNLAVALTSLFVFVGALAAEIALIATGTFISLWLHLGLSIAAVVGIILYLVFNARKKLKYRAGNYVEGSEYQTLIDKAEFYNI